MEKPGFLFYPNTFLPLKSLASDPQTLPVEIAIFTSAIAWVTLISRGQAVVQLKIVRQRQTPNCSPRMFSRSL
jgi:hypothetical protein